ncbi:TPA: hypothetical protein RQN23_002967 [Aeromonas veronii]|nr:hypothetical protein [Aeromonas veronii]
MGEHVNFFKDQFSLMSFYVVKLIQLIGAAWMIYIISHNLSFDTITMAALMMAAPMVLSSYFIRFIQLLGAVLFIYGAWHNFSLGIITVGILLMVSPILRASTRETPASQGNIVTATLTNEEMEVVAKAHSEGVLALSDSERQHLASLLGKLKKSI